MKTKSCADYIEEFAGYVAESDSLNEEAAAHLRKCADCQQKVADLKKVAAVCCEEALRIRQPRRRLRRTEVERSLTSEGRQSRSIWWRLLAGGVAILVASAISVNWKSPQSIGLAVQVNSPPVPQLNEPVMAPTMLALSHDLQSGREHILTLGPTRSGISHYRVRDVERELR